jgi:hypothetical protein
MVAMVAGAAGDESVDKVHHFLVEAFLQDLHDHRRQRAIFQLIWDKILTHCRNFFFMTISTKQHEVILKLGPLTIFKKICDKQ